MSSELEQLKAQILMRDRVAASRGTAVLALTLEGLRATITDARTGDPEARKAIRHIRGILREIDTLGAIAAPGDD